MSSASHVIAVADPKAPLGPQVWRHAEQAAERGLELVLEVHAKPNAVSRAISKLWKRSDTTVAETLAGIHLLRVDVVAAGPKAVVGLTPYAIFGVPLFVAWNPLGQVLAANALSSTDETELLSVLSAFFEDVAARRPHELYPTPPLPLHGAQKKPKKALQVEAVTEPSGAASKDAAQSPTDVPAAPEAAPPPEETATERLARELDRVLTNALAIAARFLQERDLRSDRSLHSLRQLDAYLDEHADECRSPEFARQYLGALGVYLGSVVCARADAAWFVDRAETSPVEALSLRVKGPAGDEVFRPIAVALRRLSDESSGFYGHAVAICRVL